MQHDIKPQCTAGVIQPIYTVTFVQLTLAVFSAQVAKLEVVLVGSVKDSLLRSSQSHASCKDRMCCLITPDVFEWTTL